MLRLWASSADYTQDMRISPELMKQLSQAYLKIRNTARASSPQYSRSLMMSR